MAKLGHLDSESMIFVIVILYSAVCLCSAMLQVSFSNPELVLGGFEHAKAVEVSVKLKPGSME